ncbi:MAG TPA: hypothetical protein VM536_18125, partial [Chloroflexia bacterium]|nr:hypothetical protein [Chloroflexia bacterium]
QGTPTAARGGVPHQVSLLQVGTDVSARPVVSVTADPRMIDPLQLYYDAIHDTFLYSIAQPPLQPGGGPRVGLGLFRGDAAPAAPVVPLATNNAQDGLFWSSSRRFLLYRGPLQDPTVHNLNGQTRLGVSWNVATLDWRAKDLQITADRMITVPETLTIGRVTWVPNSDQIAIGARHVANRVVNGVTFRTSTTSTLLLYDPATQATEPVLDGADASVLTAVDERQLLLSVSRSGSGQISGGTDLVLAEQNGAGWATRTLGEPFPSGTTLRLGGLLPGRDAVLVAATRPAASLPGSTIYYHVPLAGGPPRAVADGLVGGAFAAFSAPPTAP